MKDHTATRRAVVKSSIFGMLAVAIPNILFSRNITGIDDDMANNPKVFHRYPSIDDAIVAEVVGASHFNLPRLKELVDARPELARATWDWAFGDWESAIGAASHVGRRDIAQYLLSKGARPDIFTFTMLGHHDVVKSMIESQPGIQTISGPHGISLLQHAKNGFDTADTPEQKNNSTKLISYLESLDNADVTEKYLGMEETEKSKYLGDYIYGSGPTEGFSIKLNMKKMISLGKLGKQGGALLRRKENVFTYQGSPSVTISFGFEGDKVVSLTVTEPGLKLTAKKV
jgi:hypothetical protein